MSDSSILLKEILDAIEECIKNNKVDTANELFNLTIKELNNSEVNDSDSIAGSQNHKEPYSVLF
jgi:hypothetical protein